MTFKIGDKVVLKENKGICDFCSTNPKDAYAVVTKVMPNFKYDIYNSNGDLYESGHYCYTEDNFVLAEKTLENLVKGDTLHCEDEYGDYTLTIQGRIGDVYVTINNDEESNTYSIKELEAGKWEIKKQPNVKEMTVEEISKALGHEVKVVKETK